MGVEWFNLVQKFEGIFVVKGWQGHSIYMVNLSNDKIHPIFVWESRLKFQGSCHNQDVFVLAVNNGVLLGHSDTG